MSQLNPVQRTIEENVVNYLPLLKEINDSDPNFPIENTLIELLYKQHGIWISREDITENVNLSLKKYMA